ncbi:MAG: hypothetical protein KAJ86_05145 [Alphaproteobacteria bacterium]|nr:hypothetical protein [Alphaproteobacteria bacterium]
MLKVIITVLSVTAFLGFSQISKADTVDNAYKFCYALDSTGLLSEPCKVSGWGRSIDVSIDTSSSEARKICSGIVAQASQLNIRFDDGWKIKIYSPYSNGNTIAQCNL